MGHPDNVGGLPELPELPEPRLRPYKQLDTVYYNAGQMKEYARAYGELCRAAPAGGDPARGKIDPSWSLFDRVDFALRDAGFDLDEASDIAALASGVAPAGSGEVEKVARELELMAECIQATSPKQKAVRLMECAALLRKLQQGADEIKRLREIEHYCWHLLDNAEDDGVNLTIDLEISRRDIDKLNDLLPESHPDTSASQGQEGGHARD